MTMVGERALGSNDDSGAGDEPQVAMMMDVNEPQVAMTCEDEEIFLLKRA